MQHLWLLGPVRVDRIPKAQENNVTIGGERRPVGPAPRFRSRRTKALLGYLVAEARPAARELLAALFWPDEAISEGRSNLRRELHNLAQILPGCWDMDRQSVAFVPSADVFVDLYTLRQLEAEERWQEAADLLGGEFLEGVDLDDNAEFENWLLGERERWRARGESVLARVIEALTRRGHYADALHHTRRLLQLAPWNEDAHRRAMQLMAWTGQRGAALRQFETCKQVLWKELGAQPSDQTVVLCEQIRVGQADLPPQLPSFLAVEGARHETPQPLFVERKRELARLDAFLGEALAGRARVVLITGGPGQGKTALLDAFARRAMAAHPSLLVAGGNCTAYASVGDPYLPFRDVMAMLSGDVEAKWNTGAITREHAQRLWSALPLVVQNLLDHGSNLLDVLVPGMALLARATVSEPAGAPWLARLREHVNRPRAIAPDLQQSYLFQQVTRVLCAVAQHKPLLLILDDLQWADAASISLLFHLGRRLASRDSRILIACAYRPEEVPLDRAGPSTQQQAQDGADVGQARRHELAGTLSELKRIFGDVQLDLGQSDRREGRRFIDALLDAEPNRLGEGFRATLFQRTEGHPLFTVELLRAMQERGDLRPDEDGYWVEGPALDWALLPARVEAVIEERIERLDPELREILTIASVEGETFTGQVVAKVRKAAERSLLHRLSLDLERRHRLVREQEEIRTGQRRLSRYRFRHALFRDYVYGRLGLGERRLLHRDVAAALENLYGEQVHEMAVQLAHHYQEAGHDSRALRYLTLAAEHASRVYANDEAVTRFTQAIELAPRVSPDAVSLATLRRGRALAYETLGSFDGAHADHNAILRIARRAGERRMEWRALLDLGKLWASRDYHRARECLEQALRLARGLDEPMILAESLNWMGNWHANADESPKAIQYHQEALQIVEQSGDPQDLANTLDLLGLAHLLGSNMTTSVQTYDQAIALCRELGDRPRLVTALIARAVNVSQQILLASVPANPRPDSLRDFEEAAQIAREIGSASDEIWGHWALGQLHTVQGRFGPALETIRAGLRVASTIGHREYAVANRCALGLLYVELLAPEQALQQLKRALDVATDLRSRLWIHHITGGLAGAYCLLEDSVGAHNCLKAVLAAGTPMDTLGTRYCWARRAELALAQGNPRLALSIIERLIASAHGIQPGRVITFLWKLKGEALAAMGQMDEARVLLRDAIENAEVAGERFLLWRVHASLGRLYGALGRQSEAEKEFSTARELVQELADTTPDGELRDNFLQRAHERLGMSEEPRRPGQH